MDRAIPPPPMDSCFIVDVDEEARPRLSWFGPTGGVVRYGGALFLGVWLCGWAVGEVVAITILFGLVFGVGVPVQGGGGGGEICGALFLTFWLCGWTFGGIAAMYSFYNLVRRPRPERLVLGADFLHYDPGTSLLWPPNRYERPTWNRAFPWKLTRPRTIYRDKLGKIIVDRVGERQRLTVDVGAERVEIGPSLTEPEREWLAEVLRAWAGTREI